MMAEGAPPMQNFLIGAMQFEGHVAPPPGTTAFVRYNGVQPGYFKGMGIQLVQGTMFSDTSEKSDQVMVNEGFAKKYWPRQNAVGHRLRVVFNGKGDWMTIVGVVGDAFTSGLTNEASEPLLYKPFQGGSQPALVLRAAPGRRRGATRRARGGA